MPPSDEVSPISGGKAPHSGGTAPPVSGGFGAELLAVHRISQLTSCAQPDRALNSSTKPHVISMQVRIPSLHPPL